MASMGPETPGDTSQHASAPSEPSEHRQRSTSATRSIDSEDSPTVLHVSPPPSESSTKPSSASETQRGGQPPRPNPQRADTSAEPKKCWICLQDETEDTLTSSRWRSPCACRLEAHEACLLDWVAEVEAPTRGPGASKVRCPQCKTAIRVVRPQSYFLDVFRRVQRIRGRLLLPTCAVLLGLGATTSLYAHGFSSIVLIFGVPDTYLLPTIPVSLLLSQTTYADKLLPVLPLWYLTMPVPSMHAPLWPPSAPMTVMALPYVRAIYNAAYKYLFAEAEKAWIKELQHRESKDEEGNGEQDLNHADENEGQMNVEFGIEVEVINEAEEEAEPQHPPAPAPAVSMPNQAPPDQAPRHQDAPAQEGHDHGPPAPNQEDQATAQQAEVPLAAQLEPPALEQNPQQNQNGGGAANVANAIPILVNVVLEKAVGALIFPGIAAGMGYALKLALPVSWTTPPPELGARSILEILRGDKSTSSIERGFLYSRFGRSIAGGCLFIVLKDSLGLYSKYRMAQTHRQRSIADYAEKERKQGSSWFL